jgi:HD-like signal output (HDOD) protein
MNDALTSKVDSLPPLPKTILDLEEFKKSANKDLEELLAIVEQDPLTVATLLKVANSAMFGFNNKVETASRAIHLLGVNFTLSIAFGSAIKNAFKTDLEAYGISADQFMRLANMSSNLLSLWYGRIDNELKEDLLLPVFLLETGRFILSSVAADENKKEEFLAKIRQNPLDIPTIEKNYFNATSTEVTASVFRHWNLSENLINMIAYTDNVDESPDKLKKHVHIINVIKTVCNVTDPLGDKFAQEGIARAKQFGLDTNNLEKAIEKMQDRLLEE